MLTIVGALVAQRQQLLRIIEASFAGLAIKII